MKWRIVALAATICFAASCRDATAPVMGTPFQLEVRAALYQNHIDTADSLHIRLVARNPLKIPIEFELICGEPGLSFRVIDSFQTEYIPDPNIGCDRPSGVHSTRDEFSVLAPGDSIVREAYWKPRRIASLGRYDVLTPGPYAVQGVFRTLAAPGPTSDPIPFELLAAP